MKICVIGNCQADVLRPILERIVKGCFVGSIEIFPNEKILETEFIVKVVSQFDVIFLQNVSELPRFRNAPPGVNGAPTNFKFIKSFDNVFIFPLFLFSGYTPDYVSVLNKKLKKMENDLSNIMLMAYGCSVKEARVPDLFSRKFISLLDYESVYAQGKNWLIRQLDLCGMHGEYLFDKWEANGPFMYTMNHPKMNVMADVALRV